MDDQTTMNYITFLDSIPPFSDKMDLIGMHNMLNLLDNFHETLSVIHIAGTNGKGSCASMLASIYGASGYHVGAYLSPYIDNYRECIHINGSLVSIDTINAATQVIQKAYHTLRQNNLQLPTQYECLTCIALYAMHLEHVDLAIIETLMGGRDDATNVFPSIKAALITSIGYDHMEFLGDRLVDIAMHKAGIAKPKCPLFINPNAPEVIDTIATYAQSIEAPYYISHAYLSMLNIDYQRFLPLPLNGKHQIDNFFGVLSVLTYLHSDYPVTNDSIFKGLATLHHPCRIENFNINGHLITIDGGHNNEGLSALYDYLVEQDSTDALPILLVFGSLKGKKNQQGLALLSSLASEVITTTPKSPRALKATDYTQPNYTPVPSLDHCIDLIKERIKKRNPRTHIVICGSFYIAHPFRIALDTLSHQL